MYWPFTWAASGAGGVGVGVTVGVAVAVGMAVGSSVVLCTATEEATPAGSPPDGVGRAPSPLQAANSAPRARRQQASSGPAPRPLVPGLPACPVWPKGRRTLPLVL